ncbi:hypothetical protein B0H13DRAFT_1905566 [Mycena leptocephala]|nr:hypothetical protein B0H13DRAFT_1905566 [Mycena leptocephala]
MNATKENNPRNRKRIHGDGEYPPVTTPGRRPKEGRGTQIEQGKQGATALPGAQSPGTVHKKVSGDPGNGNTGRGAEGAGLQERRRPDLAIAQTNADLMLMSDEWLSQNIGLQHWHWAVGRKNDVVVKSKRLLRQLIRQPITAKRLPFFSPRPTRFENSKA